jgi:hypothetical protein
VVFPVFIFLAGDEIRISMHVDLEVLIQLDHAFFSLKNMNGSFTV